MRRNRRLPVRAARIGRLVTHERCRRSQCSAERDRMCRVRCRRRVVGALRRCAACGHIGCSTTRWPPRDCTLARHGHPIIRSFEPGEDWFWNYGTNEYYDGPNSRRRNPIPRTRPFPVPPTASPETGWPSFRVGPTESGYSDGDEGTSPTPKKPTSAPQARTTTSRADPAKGTEEGVDWSDEGSATSSGPAS